MDASGLLTNLQQSWPVLAVAAIVLYLAWRFFRPAIHRMVLGLLRAQDRALQEQVPEEEVLKRAATIEQLIAGVVRLSIVLVLVFVFLDLFDLWPVLAGLGLIGAAITVAGQSIVLDYLMGLLILLEGQYYKGDTISTGTPAGSVEGVVEEVGLRRTVLRDATGTVHSISNGLIRQSSNLTRVYAQAIVDLPGVAEEDIERAIEIMDRVGEELATDPAWKDRVLEVPHYVSTTAVTGEGVTLRMSGRVKAADRWSVPDELRRRLLPALRRAGIDATRRQPPSMPPGPPPG
jgi:small conductance mechanosensitive channel